MFWLIFFVLVLLITIALFFRVETELGNTMVLPIATRLSFRAYALFIGLSIYSRFILNKRANNREHLLLANTLLLASIIDCAGNALGIYQMNFIGVSYDKYVHLITPMLLAIGFGYFFMSEERNKNESSFVLLTILLVLSILAALFEIYESISDKVLGTNMVIGFNDTLYDILLDYLGVMVGIGVLFALLYIKTFSEESKEKNQ